jgi:hypothetical protein
MSEFSSNSISQISLVRSRSLGPGIGTKVLKYLSTLPKLTDFVFNSVSISFAASNYRMGGFPSLTKLTMLDSNIHSGRLRIMS